MSWNLRAFFKFGDDDRHDEVSDLQPLGTPQNSDVSDKVARSRGTTRQSEIKNCWRITWARNRLPWGADFQPAKGAKVDR
jgi:hypothetical protein